MTTSSTALLVIDAQESFRRRDDWSTTANPAVLDNIALLVDHARASGDAVVWITHADPGSGGVFDPQNGQVRVMAELGQDDAETALTKTTINAFASTDLHERLESQGIRRLVVCGIRTEQCCETTTRHASDLGFAVDYVTEATLTFDMTDRHGRVFTVDEIKARTELVLHERFARIATVEEALDAA